MKKIVKQLYNKMFTTDAMEARCSEDDYYYVCDVCNESLSFVATNDVKYWSHCGRKIKSYKILRLGKWEIEKEM